MGEKELRQLISGCVKQDRKSQKLLYKAFYGFAMSICLRYTGSRDEASEVMNQGFLKVFMHIDRYNPEAPFNAWLGRIMINVSIDFYRANLKVWNTEDIDTAVDVSSDEMVDKNLNYEDLLAMVRQLPQAYRTVFNLFAIEGYSHDEIGEMLKISTGTSKSNLFKARQKLKEMIIKAEAPPPASNTYKTDIDFAPIAAVRPAGGAHLLINKGIIK